MATTLPALAISVNEHIYLKDPNSSPLGMRIIEGSIDMIATMGFEAFTFKKLATQVGTTEASIYRYFESKHKLLLYLASWYWAWMEIRLAFALANVDDPHVRLHKAIGLLAGEIGQDLNYEHIDESKLNEIIVAESSKVYLTKDVDKENQEGVFLGYKQLVETVSEIILEINPNFKYPHMLVSTIIEGAHHQRFFTEHLPRLTDRIEGEDAIVDFYLDLVQKAIR